uniref:Superoxide dismutase [Cu-Zn] n=1 Tax=Laqueus rubellus TaxID=93892 RepID=A0A3G9CM21_LAQRU
MSSISILFFAVLIIVQIHGYEAQGSKYPQLRAKTLNAHCQLEPSTGLPPEQRIVRGAVSFSQQCRLRYSWKWGREVWFCSNLLVSVTVDGLPLDGSIDHGFHVHEKGDLSTGCGSTGGHFNPEGVNHGAPGDRIRHVGDFGNLRQNNVGSIKETFHDSRAVLFSSRNNIIGRAIVIHAGKDDLGTGGDAGSRASGNAGARLACCVIGYA